MITVNNLTKEAWKSEISQKHITVTVTGVGTIDESNIDVDSFELIESIVASPSIEFVGCIARKLTFTTDAFNDAYLKNKQIKVWLQADHTQRIAVFTGIIDESVKASMKGLKTIVAYDDFYRLSQIDVSGWWNSLGVSTIYRSFLSFKAKYGIDNYVLWLQNGDYPCFGGTKKRVREMSGLDYLMQLCQINGVIGYIDGDGMFSVKHLNEQGHEDVPVFKDFEYEDYDVKAIDKIIIRNTSDESGVFYPYSGVNSYIIQGNIFAYDQTGTDLLEMAQNILDEVAEIGFKPFSAFQIAYPWLECGDTVSYTDVDDEGVEHTLTLLVTNRRLSGNQFMSDEYSAEGEQDQRLFITDLQMQVEDIKNQMEEDEEKEDNNYRGIVLVEYNDNPEVEIYGGIAEVVNGIVTEIS